MPPRQPAHDPVALLLVHSAVQRLGPEAPAVQGLGDLVHLVPGPAEDDRGGRHLQVKHAREGGRLVPAWRHVGGLPYQQPLGRRRRLASEFDPHRVAQVAADHAVDPRRHGRREQRGLPILGSFAQYQLDVLGEAHVKHLVGLVEHDDLKAAQVQRSPGDVVERAPGRRHHDVDTAVKRTQLPADRLPAVDRQHPHAHVAPVAVHRRGDLYRELARRHEDQGEHSRLPAPAGDPLEHGKREGGRLARPRRGLPNQVTARDQRRDGSSLDWRRLLVAEAGQRPAQSGEPAPARQSRWHPRHRPRPKNNRLARKAPITLPHWLHPWPRCGARLLAGYLSSATGTLASPAMSWPRR